MENVYTKDEIKMNVYSWVERYLRNFAFRQYQHEYIVDTIYNILTGKRVNIIEAPTGSGKSIMVIIMAGVLDKFYHLNSYILCSDLYLWNQYAEAIEEYNLYFGKIKGALNNYTCDITSSDYSVAPCKLLGIPFASLSSYEWQFKNGWGCASSCEYILNKKRAIAAPVTLMTYQLFFPLVNDETCSARSPFGRRDIVFCDECHNVPDLCQQYGTIVIDKNKDIALFKSYYESFNSLQKNWPKATLYDTDKELVYLADLYDRILNCSYRDQQKYIDLLSEYWSYLNKPLIGYKVMNDYYSSKKSKHKLSKKEYSLLNNGKWIDALSCSIKIYMLCADGHIEYVVKTDNQYQDPDDWRNMLWPENPQTCYKFAKEDMLVHEFLLKNCNAATIMLSATVGDHVAFDDNIGTKYTDQPESSMMVMPSTFDFSKSPIYYLPGNKMSKDYIEQSMVKNAAIINKILKSPKHANEKGIIHTGSYKNTHDLLKLLDEDVRKRIHIYSSAKEKKDILYDYEHSKNGVLIGPTLTEGIDFPDDGCRFIIILKIPYPYLGDNLVKAKCSLFPRWYNSQTSNNVIQGIGRGNRTPHDWSTTYILDGSFSRLYEDTRLQYPKETRDRIKLITL